MSQLVRSLAALGLTTASGDNPTDSAVVGGLAAATVGAATTPRPDYRTQIITAVATDA
jgi:hypothetical protein